MPAKRTGPPSYGVVPWAYVNDHWYFLTQAGYSTGKYDFKVDPLRGQSEPARLLDFSGLQEPGREERNTERDLLFHVQIIPSLPGPYSTYEPVADVSTSGQATCRAADFRHLCAAFDSNRQMLLQKVKQELEREQPDLNERKKLEKKRDDLMSHVSLVWVRLDDVQGDQMGHPPKIRIADQVEKMVGSLQQSTDTGRRLPPNFSATCKLLTLREDAQIVTFKAEPASNPDSLNSVAIPSDIEWQYSTRFLSSVNIEEYLWGMRKRQIELYKDDRKEMEEYLKRQGYAESIISAKLHVVDDITQGLNQMHLVGGQGGKTGGQAWGHQCGGRGVGGGGGSRGDDRCGNCCHTIPQQRKQGGNFKTQLCKYWPKCRNGEECKFAHGQNELRRR